MLAKCPHCEHSFIVDDKLAEDIIVCQSCKEEFVPGPMRGPETDSEENSEKTVNSSNLTACPDCGNSISPSARSCPKCGRLMTSEEKPSIVLIVILWLCGLFIPFIGMWIVVILTSILYYVWKRDYPQKAKIINRQGWIIFLIGFICSFVLLALR